MARFRELCDNKWYSIMNLSLEIIKTSDPRQKRMLMKYGFELF